MTDTRSIKDTLDNLLQTNDTVFITAHNRPDFDALGAAMGMALICKKLKKKCYIIIDESDNTIDGEVRRVIEDIKIDVNIIDSNDIKNRMEGNNLLITVDVNKDYLISPNTRECLPLFSDVMILDHHKADDNTIKTNNTFIYDKLSSTCEEVSRLIYDYKVKITPNQANYLLAGIILDTNKLSKNTTTETFKVITELTARGADAAVANNMFLEDYENDRRMLRIVNNVIFPTFVYAIAYDEGSDKIYTTEDIAKASDYLLKYKINACFAIGYIDSETISISARSKGMIDVAALMKLFGGGGNEYSAAARVKGMTIEEVRDTLNLYLAPTNGNDLYQEKTREETKTLRLVK